MPANHLYTYLPKSTDVKKDGLRSIATLDGDEWKKYIGRAGSDKKEDVVAWLEGTFKGRTRAFSCFTHPIPDDADPAILKFRNAKQLVILPSYEELKKLGLVEACWKTNIGRRGCTSVDGPNYNEEMNWVPHDPKLLFTHTNHYIIVMKNGIIPGKYCTVVKNPSNEDLSAEVVAAKAIVNVRDNLVYHGSPKKLDKLAASASTTADAMGSVCVTPCKALAYCFLIDKQEVLSQVEKQFARRVLKCNFGYDIWNKPVSELYKAPQRVVVELNIRGIKPFSGKSTGYIYTVDFSKYKDKCHMYHNSDVEVTIKGDVDYIKREKVEVNWTCVSSELAIKQHGEGQLGTSDLGRESGEALMVHKWSMNDIFIHKENHLSDEQLNFVTVTVNLAAKASNDESWTVEEVKNKVKNNNLEVYFFLQKKFIPGDDRSFTNVYHPMGALLFNPKNMFITSFAIIEKAQGQGVGFLSLKKFILMIKAKHQTKNIYINVASGNTVAKALYKKVGFVEESTTDGACRMVYKSDHHEQSANEALQKEWTITDITNIDTLKQFYKHCRYALVDWKADKCWKDTHKNTTFEDWEREWRLLTPEQIIKYRCGICYDTAMMTKYFLDKWGIQNQFYFGYTTRSKSDDYNDDPTHTFVIYKDQDKWKWLEGSWGSFKDNDWSESDPGALVRNIGKALANSSHQTNLIAKITSFPKYGVDMANFYHFLKSQIYNPQFEVEPDPKYAEESFMSEYATISFPKEEISTISKQSRIITTRVSADYDKYHVGDMVRTPWDKVYKVTNRIEIKNVKDHPYFSELTKDQIEFLKKYDKIAVLTLELQESAQEEYYYGMNPEDEIPDYDPMSELKKEAMGHPVDQQSTEAFTLGNVSLEENVVQEQGTSVIIRGFPVAAFFKQLSKHYQTHKLENLIQIVHSIGISQWTVNTRTVKVHRFFLPEIVYLLNKFNMSQTLIGDIQRGSWMGAPLETKTKCDVGRIKSNMNCTLMEHQQKFVDTYAEMKDNHRLRGYLLSFGQGLGKTITAIALMEALGKERVVVICPKNTMVETWKSHFQRFYKKEQTVYVAGVDKEFTGQRFCVFNYDAINKIAAMPGIKCPNLGIIVDECHNFLRQEAQRTQVLTNLIKSGIATDVLLISGTPVKGGN